MVKRNLKQSTPSQQRRRRERLAQYGNTRLIPTVIRNAKGLAKKRALRVDGVPIPGTFPGLKTPGCLYCKKKYKKKVKK